MHTVRRIEALALSAAGKYGTQLPAVGFLLLDGDVSPEWDFRNLAAGLPVDICVSRIHYDVAEDYSSFRDIGPALTDSARHLVPAHRLGAISYSCTSGTVLLGYEEVARRIRMVREDVAVVTPLTAAAEAVRALGHASMSLLTPYPEWVTTLMADYYEEQGIRIARIGGIETPPLETTLIKPDAIMAAARDMKVPESNLLFISCTALRTSSIIARLEEELKCSVITSNQVQMWSSLRHAGFAGVVNGFGRLMHCPLAAESTNGVTL